MDAGADGFGRTNSDSVAGLDLGLGFGTGSGSGSGNGGVFDSGDILAAPEFYPAASSGADGTDVGRMHPGSERKPSNGSGGSRSTGGGFQPPFGGAEAMQPMFGMGFADPMAQQQQQQQMMMRMQRQRMMLQQQQQMAMQAGMQAGMHGMGMNGMIPRNGRSNAMGNMGHMMGNMGGNMGPMMGNNLGRGYPRPFAHGQQQGQGYRNAYPAAGYAPDAGMYPPGPGQNPAARPRPGVRRAQGFNGPDGIPPMSQQMQYQLQHQQHQHPVLPLRTAPFAAESVESGSPLSGQDALAATPSTVSAGAALSARTGGPGSTSESTGGLSFFDASHFEPHMYPLQGMQSHPAQNQNSNMGVSPITAPSPVPQGSAKGSNSGGSSPTSASGASNAGGTGSGFFGGSYGSTASLHGASSAAGSAPGSAAIGVDAHGQVGADDDGYDVLGSVFAEMKLFAGGAISPAGPPTHGFPQQSRGESESFGKNATTLFPTTEAPPAMSGGAQSGLETQQA
jgi:hypothetical protein